VLKLFLLTTHTLLLLLLLPAALHYLLLPECALLLPGHVRPSIIAVLLS